MTIRRLDHVSVVVDDLSHAIDFFTALGMAVEGQAPVEGPVVDRLCGLAGIKADIAMMRTPDGYGRWSGRSTTTRRWSTSNRRWRRRTRSVSGR